MDFLEVYKLQKKAIWITFYEDIISSVSKEGHMAL